MNDLSLADTYIILLSVVGVVVAVVRCMVMGKVDGLMEVAVWHSGGGTVCGNG